MKKISAFFNPAKEEKNGYLGKATIIIADGISLEDVSVFRSQYDGTPYIRFPQFEVGQEGRKLSYVTYDNDEVYAAMCSVVAQAMESEKHFAFIPGSYLKNEPGERIEVHGKAVQEPYADARFTVDVAGMVTLHGIKTHRQAFEKNGRKGEFTAVRLPVVRSYETADGETHYQHPFQGRIRSGTLDDGTEFTIDYADMLQGLVLAERKIVLNLDRKPPLQETMNNAAASKSEPASADAPVMEPERA